MLIRISLIVAILAGLAVGTINFVKVKDVITQTRAERDDWHNKFTETDRQLTSTKKELVKTTTDLKQTKQALDTTTTERDKAQAEASAMTKKATELAEQITKTKTERDDALAKLDAYTQSGMSAAQVAALAHDMEGLKAEIAGLTAENKHLGQTVAKKEAELQMYRDPDTHIHLVRTLTGKVLVCDPKWGFVVLNVGEDQGALAQGELLVNRGGKLVAVVKITSVQKDRCVANVLPGWTLGEVMEGDQVIPQYPGS
jgi:hypothetical protein